MLRELWAVFADVATEMWNDPFWRRIIVFDVISFVICFEITGVMVGLCGWSACK